MTTHLPQNPEVVRQQIDSLFTTRSIPRTSVFGIVRGATVGLGACATAFVATYFSLGVIEPERMGTAVGAILLVVTGLVALTQLSPLARYPAWMLLLAAIPPGTAGIGMRLYEQPFIASLLLATSAALIGFAASRSVLKLSWVLPLAAAAALSDAHSVYFGPTGEFLEKSGAGGEVSIQIAPPDGLLEYVVMHLPGFGGVWRLGSIDILFAALFLGLSEHFRLPVWRTTIGLAAGFAATMLIPNGAPVIPFFALGFMAAHSNKLVRDMRYAIGNWSLSLRE